MVTLSAEKLAAAAERLAASREEAETIAYQTGKEYGAHWAADDADWEYLRTLHELQDAGEDIEFDALAEAIEGDVESGRQTLLDWLGDDSCESDASPAWLKGFVDGAVEAWKEIEKLM